MEIQTTQFTEMTAVADDQNFKETVQKNLPTTVEIQAWLVSYLAELLEIEPNEIDVKIPFERYGLDSSAAVGMTGDLEECLGYELDPTLIYDYPTIETLVGYLSEENKVKA
ncbi:MAG: acyl carrier protein [Calothrix sp. MO_167.B12]|nr:acyl carrier protein [Calothrix sp. MO_167.B12]